MPLIAHKLESKLSNGKFARSNNQPLVPYKISKRIIHEKCTQFNNNSQWNTKLFNVHATLFIGNEKKSFFVMKHETFLTFFHGPGCQQ